jgi:hypothetical protein
METTPQSVLETFARNRQAVRDLLHFDEIVLKLVMHNLEALNERWKQYLRRESSNPQVKVNPKYTADDLLKLLANIRDNDSLGGQYRAMHNQCLVLLVSFFSSSTRALFRALVVQELQRSNAEILRERLQFTVADLCADEPPLSELVADALEESKNISFQDMKSIGRAFETVLGKEPVRDLEVNDIIVAQACRHAIVHAESRADERLLKQIANATPRLLKVNLTVGQEISFTEEEIDMVATAMNTYLMKTVAGAGTEKIRIGFGGRGSGLSNLWKSDGPAPCPQGQQRGSCSWGCATYLNCKGTRELDASDGSD